VHLELASFGPVVGLVVVIHIAQKEATLRAMHDESDVGVDTHRPEVPVARLVELVELQPGMSRIELKIESGGFDGLLLVAGQPGET